MIEFLLGFFFASLLLEKNTEKQGHKEEVSKEDFDVATGWRTKQEKQAYSQLPRGVRIAATTFAVSIFAVALYGTYTELNAILTHYSHTAWYAWLWTMPGCHLTMTAWKSFDFVASHALGIHIAVNDPWDYRFWFEVVWVAVIGFLVNVLWCWNLSNGLLTGLFWAIKRLFRERLQRRKSLLLFGQSAKQ